VDSTELFSVPPESMPRSRGRVSVLHPFRHFYRIRYLFATVNLCYVEQGMTTDLFDGKPFIFLSCGQFWDSEKQLGRAIAALVKNEIGIDVFFAEQVQDLEGLHERILDSLKRCAGLIAVMHPRGDIVRPNGTVTRASVWIEQEIAIATYIRNVEKRAFPVIAFKHKLVCREGIRELIPLNPTEFSNDDEVLAALPVLLKSWTDIKAVGTIQVEIESTRNDILDVHHEHRLNLFVTNSTSLRIEQYDFELSLPMRILKHQPLEDWGWVKHSASKRMTIRQNQNDSIGVLEPESEKTCLIHVDYCLECGRKDAEINTGFPGVVFDGVIDAQLWVNGRKYSDTKSLRELHEQMNKPR
jgi:hypothetical protein